MSNKTLPYHTVKVYMKSECDFPVVLLDALEVKSQNLTVFKFPSKDELRQKWLWNIPRKF